MRWPTLGPEVETIAQMPFVAGFNGGLGVDIDEGAFLHPFDQPNHDRYAEHLTSSFMRKYTLKKESKGEEEKATAGAVVDRARDRE